MRQFPYTLLVVGLVLAVTGSARAQVGGGGSCWQCIQNQSGGYGCNGDQMIGWDSCTPGSTCDHGAECAVGSGCFLGGTLVATRNGPVPIEDVQVGDEVLSKADDHTMVYARVTRTYVAIEFEYLVINGGISVTAAHPVRVGDTWVPAEKLVIGDPVAGENGLPVVVQSIEKVGFGVRVYNIEVDGTHTFFADGVLVHNKDPHPNG